MRCLIVVPCLNEQAHIGPLLDRLDEAAARLDAQIVVADGGSTDGTLDSLQARAGGRIAFFHNARRIQSAGINEAVARYGDGFDWLMRIDAHGDYPDDFVDSVLADAEATGADSVVVAMVTQGKGTRQRAAALAQNSRLGNGGSAHRAGGGRTGREHAAPDRVLRPGVRRGPELGDVRRRVPDQQQRGRRARVSPRERHVRGVGVLRVRVPRVRVL